MPKKTIEQIDVAGRTFSSVDSTCRSTRRGKITDRRVRMAVPTIPVGDRPRQQGDLMSHLPAAGASASTGPPRSLKPCAELNCSASRSRSEQRPVDGDRRRVKSLRTATCCSSTTSISTKGEKKATRPLPPNSRPPATLCVNDAFGTCHREDASMYAVPAAMAKPRRRAAGAEELQFFRRHCGNRPSLRRGHGRRGLRQVADDRKVLQRVL